MLIIPDVHINSRMKDTILAGLRNLVDQNDSEDSLIFLWDYVYHFAYDRTSLLSLFRFFVELYHQWKKLYILAGNHDWISEQFVFEEWKLATDLLLTEQSSWTFWKIEFITQPTHHTIDWENILFLPYNVHTQVAATSFANCGRFPDIEKTIQELWLSQHKWEQFSSRVNQFLLDEVSRLWTNEKLLVIHHHYLEWVQFPWQRWRFWFKDVAIDRRFADIPTICLLSGHIHQPFVYKNYCCLWSLWATSPLEVNHCKVYGILQDNILEVLPLSLNAYMKIDVTWWEVVSRAQIEKIQELWWLDVSTNLQWNDSWKVTFWDLVMHEYSTLTLQLIVDKIDYTRIDDYVEESLVTSLQDIQLKKQGMWLDALVEKLSLADKNLHEWFSDRKGILKLYLSNKYPDESEEYETVLRDLWLL